MNDIFVYTDRAIKINKIEKRWVTKYTQSWVFITNQNNFTIKDNIRYVYQCNECGVLSNPIKNYKKILYPNGKRLCKSCSSKGKRNPFYNKTHTHETIDIIKKKTSIKSKELWKNDEYRKKVIKGTSKPRHKLFKKEQSDRVKQWYIDNPEQKIIRSICMTSLWKAKKIIPNTHSICRSKGENKLFEFLKQSLPTLQVKARQTIHIDNKWFLPDILINDKIIVEYFGDYWHGNPKKYNESSLIAHTVLAKDVWIRDKKRLDILVKNGYTVIVIWSSDDYKNSYLLERIKRLINE